MLESLASCFLFALTPEPPVAPDPAAVEAGADAQMAPADEVAPERPPGWDTLDPETRSILESMDQAAIDALTQKAQGGAPLSPEEEKAAEGIARLSLFAFDQTLNYQSGDVAVGNGLATLHLGESFRYLNPSDAQQVLVDAWGNPPGAETLGMIVPADLSPVDPERGWGVIVSYTEDGHVEDDDAEDIDYDELLESMQEATEQDNAIRQEQGYAPIHLVGWAEPPHYDGERHTLYWAKELKSEEGGENSLNYAIRVLGRKGVLELNAVSGMSQLAAIKPQMETVYGLVEFEQGNRYADFDPDLDEVAAYGLGGLIAGKVAMKAGLWAVIVKGALAAKKFLIVAGIALVAGIKALFGRKSEPQVESSDGGDAP